MLDDAFATPARHAHALRHIWYRLLLSLLRHTLFSPLLIFAIFCLISFCLIFRLLRHNARLPPLCHSFATRLTPQRHTIPDAYAVTPHRVICDAYVGFASCRFHY